MSEMIKTITENMELFFENKFVQGIIIIIIALVLVKISNMVVKHAIIKNEKVNSRLETLFRLIGRCVNVIICFFAIMQICQVVFNVQPTSLIAATGIVSVALGFGAQSIVKDVITGFMIIFENQFSVGDLVTIDGFNGRITEITLRTTLIKNIYGDILTIPNGSITKVINHSRETRCVLIDAAVSYEDDIDRACEVLKTVCDDMANEKYIVNTPEVLGVVKLDSSSVNIRLSLICETEMQFEAERVCLKKIKYAFDKNGINIPYDHIVVIKKD